jgi:hypothetical protein
VIAGAAGANLLLGGAGNDALLGSAGIGNLNEIPMPALCSAARATTSIISTMVTAATSLMTGIFSPANRP